MSRWKRPPYVMTAEQARRQVESWRAKNPDIVETWNDMAHFQHVAAYYEQWLTQQERWGRSPREWRRLHELYHEYKRASSDAAFAALFPESK